MICIHQAIYGDLNGAYSLLGSSFLNADIPTRLGNSTDPNDRPPDGVLSCPVIRGFSKDKYFLLIKSFPDVSPGVRRGRNFTHALIIEEKDFIKIHDITDLLQFLLKEIDKEASLKPIELKTPTTAPIREPIENGRITSAINGLVKHNENGNTVAWIGEDGYFEWISQLWPAIPNAVKLNLKIGIAFDPQKVESNLLNLLYVPLEVKSNWSKTIFKLVETHSKESFDSQTANWLAGNIERANELGTLIKDFAIEIKEIDDLLQFEKMIPAYNSIDSKSNLRQLLVFADLVSKYSASQKSAASNKRKLLNAVISKIAIASASDISVLANPNWSGFQNAPDELSVSLNNWLDKNLFLKENGKANTVFIESAFTNKVGWWEKTVKENLKTGLNNWQPRFAKCVWDWFVTKPKLIEALGSLLPNIAEGDLVLTLPKLEQGTAEKVLRLSHQKKWLQLHGFLAVEIYPPQEAISKQLAIDTNAGHIYVLENMASKIANKALIKATVQIKDKRLFLISGKVIKSNPRLLTDLQIEQDGWQEVWLQAVKQGSKPWDGISAPIRTLHSIMDFILGGKNFNEELLKMISNSSCNDLREYPKRRAIWNVLPQNSKGNFLTATAQSCLKQAAMGTLTLLDLENPLLNYVQTELVIRPVMMDTSLEVTLKVKLLDLLPNIKQSEVICLIDYNQFSASDAMRLGQKIQNCNWRMVAEHLYSIIGGRPDLKLTLQQCFRLLDFLKRMSLKFSGFPENTITREEWWNAITSRATDLFPYGPDQNGIWEIAGGHNADLHHNKSGKERWYHAMRLIQNGGKPKVSELLKAMLHEFPNDEVLNNLKRMI